MKKIIFTAIFCIELIAQENTNLRFEGEIIIHLINYDSSTVTIQAKRILNQGGKWYPRAFPDAGNLVYDNEFDLVVADNNEGVPVSQIFLDTEGDDAKNILAISLYKISFTDKKYFFYLNTISEETIDLHFNYDYSNDNFYSSDGSEISEGTIIKTFNSYITTGLANYWKNTLFVIPDISSSYPQLVWGPIPDFEATGYKIYRAIGNSSGLSKTNYSLIETTAANTYDYIVHP